MIARPTILSVGVVFLRQAPRAQSAQSFSEYAAVGIRLVSLGGVRSFLIQMPRQRFKEKTSPRVNMTETPMSRRRASASRTLFLWDRFSGLRNARHEPA